MITSRYIFLSFLFFFTIVSVLPQVSEANQSDFKISNYGIIRDNNFVETTDSIPLKKNIHFGVEVSFPKNKYANLIVKHNVPVGHQCKPKHEGYAKDIKDKETYRAGGRLKRIAK